MLLQEVIQNKFEREYTSLELEIRKRDEIISQLQARILELEKHDSGNDEDNESAGDSTEHDASLEDDFVDDNDEHPFMRDSSVDTVLTARSRRRVSSPSSATDSSAHNRRSWEEHSEEETLELQDLPQSIKPQSLWKDEVAIDLGSSDDSEEVAAGGPGGSFSDEDEEEPRRFRSGHNNWEVEMLAEELEKRERRKSSEYSNAGS